MRPATGWIAYFDVDAALLEHVGELAHVVLRLRDGHPVAGHDDDLARERELDGDVLRRRRAHRAAVVGARLADSRLHLPERAEEDVGDRAVHRLRHEQREQRARRADEHPGDDQDGRVEHEPRRRRREAGERVQQRDDDRHVRAADREDEHDAEDERERGSPRRSPTASSSPATIAIPSAAAPPRTTTFTTFWPGNTIGRPLTSSCSFAKATSEPANEIEPISAESTIGQRLVARLSDAVVLVELGERDERRRAAADPVEQGDHLRHRGHLHPCARRRRPTTVPIAAATTISAQFPMPSTAASSRSRRACPTPPSQFPRRACFGDERKRSARMKQTIVTR